MYIHISDSMGNFIRVLVIQIMIMALMSTHSNGIRQIHGQGAMAHAVTASDDKPGTMPQNMPKSSSSRSQFQRRGVANKVAYADTMRCQGKLQKRGQCKSQPNQKSYQSNRDRNPSRSIRKSVSGEFQSDRQPLLRSTSDTQSSLYQSSTSTSSNIYR